MAPKNLSKYPKKPIFGIFGQILNGNFQKKHRQIKKNEKNPKSFSKQNFFSKNWKKIFN